ncbi:hypothetical protein FPSE_06236 [Fusarium pseudograminearum CS3096]|uniref:Uncharacterized protein n=1 Tax=Fusarium pseudograminearum (strain CS3096) TaxID=1028729 RepID=K3VJX0_FUSPC|nr:hypothetical protein FPSE_06236 [Fusarium pseudograminearum CS3096]EKJ73618.1 hypothetical protein FPSE_06236 [Fusarium pseudograminearum CS3096]
MDENQPFAEYHGHHLPAAAGIGTATLHEWSVEVLSLFDLYSTSTIEDPADQKHRKKHDACSGSHNVTSQSVARNRLDREKRGHETSV